MATIREDALNIVQVVDGTTAAELAVLQNKVIENIEKSAVSVFLKNVDLSGNPASGSVEAKRFKNSASAPYGTARSDGAGVAVQEDKVTVYLDQDKEIVEEFEYKDIVAYGIPALMEKRVANQSRSMIRELDRAFFLEAWNEGTVFAPSLAATDIRLELEELIVSIEKTENDFVDGVEREDIALVLSIDSHSELRNEIDELPASHMLTNAGAVGMWHGVAIFTTHRLPEGVDAMGMVYGSVAQPVLFQEYQTEKIPLSTAYATSLFYTYGTKAVTPDLIKYLGDEAAGGEGEEGEGE